MKTFVVAVILALGALFMWMGTKVHAQSSMCGAYDEFVKALKGSQYGESSTGKGISGGGLMVVELFVGKETFTVLATHPASGRTCIIAAGKGWIGAAPELPGDDT